MTRATREQGIRDVHVATLIARILHTEAEHATKPRDRLKKLAEACEEEYGKALCDAGLRDLAEKCKQQDSPEEVKKCIFEHLLSSFEASVHSNYCLCDPVVVGLCGALGNTHYIYRFEVELESRGLIGVSSGPLHKVFEVGVEWHPIYNTVYLPASSVKGAIRSFLLQSCLAVATITSNKLQAKECVELVLDLLGSTESLPEDEFWVIRSILNQHADNIVLKPHLSRVIITDAMLALVPNTSSNVVSGEYVFEKHVMTPHYMPIQKVVHTEYDVVPNPIQHYVLRKGLVFRGCITIEKSASQELLKLMKYYYGVKVSNVKDALHKLLSLVFERGVGARTFRGYSHFKLRALTEVKCR